MNRDRARSAILGNGVGAGMDVGGRRRRERRARGRSVRFDLSEDEYAELVAAARSAGLARGAFAAQATLAAARGGRPSRSTGELRELLGEVMRAATLVQRIGVNLNQAVAKLNATGEAPGSLVPIAEHCTRSVDRLDHVVERVRGAFR